MAFIGSLFDSFSIFLLSLKQQENLMIFFPVSIFQYGHIPTK